MNRLRLDGTNQIINIPFDNTNIIGTGADEDLVLNISVDNLEVSIGDNDSVHFGRESSEYTITNPGGNTVEVTDNLSNLVTISVGGTGQIGFADGVTSLAIDSGTGAPIIDGNTITSSPVDMSSLSLSETPTQILNAGYANPDFTRIINGGYADSTYA